MLNDVLIGMRTFLEGVQWLSRRPGLMAWLSLPIMGGVLLFITLAGVFWNYHSLVFSQLLFTPTDLWWSQGLYVAAKVLVTIALLILSAVFGLGIVSLLAAPVYDYVSYQVEADLLGRKGPELSFTQSLLLIKEEAKKMFCIITLSILLLLIPGVNVISSLITAFLAGWDFYDYPLMRRGFSFRERRTLVWKDAGKVMGLGLWLIIPFVQVIVYPLAVVGGTMISVRRLQADGRV